MRQHGERLIAVHYMSLESLQKGTQYISLLVAQHVDYLRSCQSQAAYSMPR
jgi:hypothetical protein